MRTLKLTVAYEGTNFAGWQWQAGEPTVQGALEAALHTVTGTEVRAIASGRTDAGVHALGQVVSLRCETRLDNPTLRKALNANLPPEVVVLDVQTAPDDFHAIRDAKRKRYRYVLHDGPVRPVHERRYCWHRPPRLDDEAMRQGAAILVGRHDFKSFQTSGAERKTSVRTVFEFSVRRDPSAHGDFIVCEVEADGFLYNMVRAMVGTLVEVGTHRREPAWVAEVLAACDRTKAGPNAPPQGLFLVRVHYD